MLVASFVSPQDGSASTLEGLNLLREIRERPTLSAVAVVSALPPPRNRTMCCEFESRLRTCLAGSNSEIDSPDMRCISQLTSPAVVSEHVVADVMKESMRMGADDLLSLPLTSNDMNVRAARFRKRRLDAVKIWDLLTGVPCSAEARPLRVEKEESGRNRHAAIVDGGVRGGAAQLVIDTATSYFPKEAV